MEIILSFQQVILNPFFFLSLLDSGCEKNFITYVFKGLDLKDQSVLMSVWFHAHV